MSQRLQECMVAKGAAGLKPCVLCANVYNHNIRRDAIAAADAAGWSTTHVETDPAKFVLHTDATLLEICTRLQAPMSKAALQELQLRLGWNFIPEGVMYQGRLRELASPVEHVCFDWMHVFRFWGDCQCYNVVGHQSSRAIWDYF